MSKIEPVAEGIVTSLAIDGREVQDIAFELAGPKGDGHKGFMRRLSGHDGDYICTSKLKKGSVVFNWRSWTGLSAEEITEVVDILRHAIPVGCLLENITISGIPNFSKLPTGTRLVFPSHGEGENIEQAILAVWEENGPCRIVAERLESLYGAEGLKTNFIRAAQGKRGVMGFVLSEGRIAKGDRVIVYPPVR